MKILNQVLILVINFFPLLMPSASAKTLTQIDLLSYQLSYLEDNNFDVSPAYPFVAGVLVAPYISNLVTPCVSEGYTYCVQVAPGNQELISIGKSASNYLTGSPINTSYLQVQTFEFGDKGLRIGDKDIARMIIHDVPFVVDIVFNQNYSLPLSLQKLGFSLAPDLTNVNFPATKLTKGNVVVEYSLDWNRKEVIVENFILDFEEPEIADYDSPSSSDNEYIESLIQKHDLEAIQYNLKRTYIPPLPFDYVNDLISSRNWKEALSQIKKIPLNVQIDNVSEYQQKLFKIVEIGSEEFLNQQDSIDEIIGIDNLNVIDTASVGLSLIPSSYTRAKRFVESVRYNQFVSLLPESNIDLLRGGDVLIKPLDARQEYIEVRSYSNRKFKISMASINDLNGRLSIDIIESFTNGQDFLINSKGSQ
ncbi:hypothetical protein A1QO_06290 [Vibrio genomosp. F10 str. ZF-129]|uniref:Uncharacterized protein n=1 Tax=Vibrio genomosp. F10 str. ZF-129 TaxID=1187848 RepID=A0A1E5BG44_9VIBR|nr:hypothetical protein [Vibrio genomosp. F10]OEE34991.1 hypothetical protein A1QO_06290 [Vibrio genomosp. F10 str. ZF-129]